MAESIVELRPEETWPLRRAVLRTGTPSPEVVLDGDDDPGTLHLGVRDAHGSLIAASTWIPRARAGAPAMPAVQLRAMAIDPGQRRRGLGARLLRHGLSSMGERGVRVVWANARDTALDFYVRHGFDIDGDGFVDDATGLPHHRIVKHLSTPA